MTPGTGRQIGRGGLLKLRQSWIVPLLSLTIIAPSTATALKGLQDGPHHADRGQAPQHSAEHEGGRDLEVRPIDVGEHSCKPVTPPVGRARPSSRTPRY